MSPSKMSEPLSRQNWLPLCGGRAVAALADASRAAGGAVAARWAWSSVVRCEPSAACAEDFPALYLYLDLDGLHGYALAV